MDQDEVVIERGLPEHQRQVAALLFDEAFGAKLGIFLPQRATRIPFLARAFRADHVVVATRGGTLLGMLGLSDRAGTYKGDLLDVPLDPRRNSDVLGLGGSIRAVVGLRLGERRPEADELYVSGVAVSPAARGSGIGTRLLAESVAIARENGMRWVRLDVVDTNPRAQALYERLGYSVTKVQTFRYMQRFIGYGAMISMELPVERDR